MFFLEILLSRPTSDQCYNTVTKLLWICMNVINATTCTLTFLMLQLSGWSCLSSRDIDQLHRVEQFFINNTTYYIISSITTLTKMPQDSVRSSRDYNSSKQNQVQEIQLWRVQNIHNNLLDDIYYKHLCDTFR